jgi:hypothetical protein
MARSWILVTWQGTSGSHSFINILKKDNMVEPFLKISIKYLTSGEELKKFLLEKSMSCIKDLVTFFSFLSDLVSHFKKYVDPLIEGEIIAASILRRCISQTIITSLYNMPRYRTSLISLIT